MMDFRKVATLPIVFTSVICLLSFVLLTLGFSASKQFETIDDARGSTISQYVGLSVAAWHQEIEIYFTGKLLEKKRSTTLGLVEPELHGAFAGKYPLKFESDLSNFNISYRPYLSAPGLLADMALIPFRLGRLVGISSEFLLRGLYSLNLLVNIFFIFLLLSFLFSKIATAKGRIAAILLVVSPWVILDSLSLMWSPSLRFAGIFALLFCWWRRIPEIRPKFTFFLVAFGIVVSSLNGFEFFFFQLAILLMPMSLIWQNEKNVKVLVKWIKVCIAGSITTFLIWYLVVLENIRNPSEAAQVLYFTFFKHSLLRPTATPIGAVASGDSNLPLFSGLTKLFTDMSVFLPYPFPNSLIKILGVNYQALEFISLATSFMVITVFLIIISGRKVESFPFILSLSLFSLTALATNSYVYNHPHHMPPVLLFFLLFLTAIQFRERNVL